MKLFRTSNRDIINECCSHFCFKLPSEILPARFDRFLCKLQQQLRLWAICCNYCTVNFVVNLVKSRLFELSLVLFHVVFLNYYYYCYFSTLPFVVNKDFQKLCKTGYRLARLWHSSTTTTPNLRLSWSATGHADNRSAACDAVRALRLFPRAWDVALSSSNGSILAALVMRWLDPIHRRRSRSGIS